MKEKLRNSTVRKVRSSISATIVASTVIMLLLFGIGSGIIGYFNFSEEFTDEYSENAIRIARAAADYINNEKLDEYLENGGSSDEYLDTLSKLENLCNRVNAEFIYVIKPFDDYNKIRFVFNAVNENSEFDPYEIGFIRNTTNDEYKAKYQSLYDCKTFEETVVRDKGFIETGSHITAMIPLYKGGRKVVGILCAQRQMDALTSARNSYLKTMTIVSLILVAIVTTLYRVYLRHSFIKPLRSVVNETIRFAEKPGPAETPISEKITSSNEIGQLASSIDKMEQDTLDYIENLTNVTAERHRIGAELEVAAAIQQGMLNAVSPERPELDIFATMDPAKEVGGDFYDYYMLDDDHLCMTIADVSGKGVPASLFMAITKVLITDTALITRSPAEILRMVNERICKSNKLDMFITVWLGILEISTGRVIAANAGHEYPIIYRDGGRFELMRDKHGFVVGGMSGLKFKEYTFDMKKGDCLFLYTDGAPEATNADEQLFGTERMLKALNESNGEKPEELIKAVKDSIDCFVGEAPQFDDLTMMCLKYYGKEETDEI